jgi:hypothetical protein
METTEATTTGDITRKHLKTQMPKRRYQCVFFELNTDFHTLDFSPSAYASGTYLGGLVTQSTDAPFGLDAGDIAVFVHTTVRNMLEASQNLLRVPGITHVLPWQQINVAKSPKTVDRVTTPTSTFVLLGTNFPLSVDSAELQSRLLVSSDFEHQTTRFSTTRVAKSSARCLFQFVKNCISVTKLPGPVSDMKKISHAPGYDVLVLSNRSPNQCWFVDKASNATPLSASLETRFANWLVNSDASVLTSVNSTLDALHSDRFKSESERKDAIRSLKKKFCLVKSSDDFETILENVKLWKSRISRRVRINRKNKRAQQLKEQQAKKGRSKVKPVIEKKKRTLNDKLNKAYLVSSGATSWIKDHAKDLLPQGAETGDGAIYLRTQDFVKLVHAYIRSGTGAVRSGNVLNLRPDADLLNLYRSSLPTQEIVDDRVSASSIMALVSKNLVKN